MGQLDLATNVSVKVWGPWVKHAPSLRRLPSGARCCCIPKALSAGSSRRAVVGNLGLGMFLAAGVLVHPIAASARVSIVDVDRGIRYSEVSVGHGDMPKAGDIVMVDVVGTLEDGKLFLDTRQRGAPLAFQLGTTNKYVPEGLSQALENMHGGSRRLAVIPSSLGYGEREVQFPQGKVPPSSPLFYDIELLRCQQFPIGLACCPDAKFPCIKDGEQISLPVEMNAQTKQQ